MSCYTTGNTGRQYCGDGSGLGDPIGVILATDAFSMTAANFLLKSAWDTAINARSVFPIIDIVGFTDNSTDPTYIEHPNEKRKLSRQGKYRFSIDLDLNEAQKKALLPFRGFGGRIFFVYLNRVIRGTSTDAGVTVKGARVEMLNVRKEKFNAIGEGSMVTVDIDLKSEEDINLYDNAMEMSWDVSELDGLTEVDLAVDSASATSVVVSVTSSSYGSTNPITGLVFADFDISDLSGASGATDNGDGTYTIAGTLMATGTINLVAPTAMTTTDLHVVSSGSAIVTIA